MGPPIAHGLCVMAGSWVIAPVPTREWPLAMGYHRLWVIRGMDYNGVDCTHVTWPEFTLLNGVEATFCADFLE